MGVFGELFFASGTKGVFGSYFLHLVQRESVGSYYLSHILSSTHIEKESTIFYFICEKEMYAWMLEIFVSFIFLKSVTHFYVCLFAF
jgi:hypothetical protein